MSYKFTKVYTNIDQYYILRSGGDMPNRILEEGHTEITKIHEIVSENDLLIIIDGEPRYVDNYKEIMLSRKWTEIREQRNELLRQTDFSQLADMPFNEETKLNYRKYRQGLRDITNQPDPFNITWPTL